MSKLFKHRLILAVQDLRASSEYWISVLGFARDFGDESDGWSWLSRGEFAVGLGHCPHVPAARTLGDHSYVTYVNVDDVDALYEEFRQRGAILPQPPATKPWGMREFAVHTPDGHRMTFGAETSASPLLQSIASTAEANASQTGFKGSMQHLH